jgi:hypothetical protein
MDGKIKKRNPRNRVLFLLLKCKTGLVAIMHTLGYIQGGSFEKRGRFVHATCLCGDISSR